MTEFLVLSVQNLLELSNFDYFFEKDYTQTKSQIKSSNSPEEYKT